MAVQARYLATHAFRHDPRAIRPELDYETGETSVFLGDTTPGSGNLLLLSQLQSRGNNTVLSDPPSELTCKNNNDNYGSDCFVPRKRARVGDVSAACSLIMDGHGGALLPQAFAAAAGDVQSRELGSGAASTSATPPVVVSQGFLSQLHRHGIEIDALVRVENERLRAGLQEAQRRHLRALVSVLERAAAQRLRAAESDLERALVRGAELEEELQQMVAEGQAWQVVADGHEAEAAGLRSTLDQLLQQPCAGAEAEDARSCCFEQDRRAAHRDGARTCKSCGEADACVLLLPCRHLCLCARCEAAVDACPVCAATKNASLHVLLS